MPRQSNQAAPLKIATAALTLSTRQHVTLNNMHWRRRCAILRRMEHGASFSAAEKSTYHVFDTVGWHEITSRLRRARGFVHKWAPFLANSGTCAGSSALLAEARALAIRIADESRGLCDVMKSGGFWHRAKVAPTTRLTVPKPRMSVERLSAPLMLGKLKAALRFVAKSHRDAPHLIQGEIAPTVREQATIAAEIRCLLASSNLLR